MDKLVRGTAKDGMVRVIGAITTDIVNYGTKAHECTPVASAALGRMLTAGVLVGSTLKSEKEKVTLKMDGGGEAKGVTVVADSKGNVKGYIGILIHAGSTQYSSAGCIIVGHNTIKGRVTDSQETFKKLYKIMKEAHDKGEKIFITIE